MTRIGFAYNQKPVLNPLHLSDSADSPRSDSDPSSRRRKWNRRARPDDATPLATPAAPAAERQAPSAEHQAVLTTVNDEYAEWDAAETIDAVEHALESLGEVIRL